MGTFGRNLVDFAKTSFRNYSKKPQKLLSTQTFIPGVMDLKRTENFPCLLPDSSFY